MGCILMTLVLINPKINLPPVFKGGDLYSTYSLKSFSLKITHTLLIMHGFQQLVTVMAW